MAKSKIAGLTIEIGGDTSQLSKALKQPNDEARDLQSKLKAIDQALKFDPNNTELLEQKFRLLGQAIDTNEQKLQMLKTAQEQFKASGKDIDSSEYIELQRQIALTTNKVDQLRKQKIDMMVDTSDVSKANSALDNLDKNVEETKDSVGSLGDAFKGAFSAEAFADVGSQIVDTMSSIVEESQEYNRIMGALEVSSQNLNYSNQETMQTYNQLYGVLGDTQTAATATSNLQSLGLEQDKLRQLTEGAIGAWAQYGDSIPIDGLAEAINETVQTGVVTGTFADVLNWAGTSEDEFNKKLEGTNSTTERANMILKELSDQGLIDSANAFRDNNQAMIEYNESQASMEEATSSLAETLTPIFTTLNNVLSSIIGLFSQLPGPVQTAITVILGIVAVLSTLAPAIMAVTMAVTSLSVPLLPLAGIILGIVAAITAVVLIFQNWGSIVQFFGNLWNSIWPTVTNAFNTAKEAINGGISAIIGFFQNLITNIISILGSIISNVVSFGVNIGAKALEIGSKFVSGIINFVINLPSNLWNIFTSVLSRVSSFASNIWKKATEIGSKFISNVIHNIISLPSKIWSIFTNVVSKVTSWGSSLAKKGADAAKKLFNAVWNGIKSLPSKVVSIGSNLVKGIWNGIGDMTGWIIDKIGGFADSVVDSICSFFGIASPSKVMKKLVGKNIAAGIGEGIADNENLALYPLRQLEKEMTSSFNPNVAASVTQALNYNGTITVESPIEIDLDGKPIYNNVVRRITKNQGNRMAFQGV